MGSGQGMVEESVLAVRRPQPERTAVPLSKQSLLITYCASSRRRSGISILGTLGGMGPELSRDGTELETEAKYHMDVNIPSATYVLT